MLATSRSYALAAAAIAAVSTVVAMPIIARQAPPSTSNADAARTVSTDVQLVDSGESLLNIPLNLLDDIVNIPYNETIGGGLGTVADSFLFTGTWWVPSSTNLWGIDPGDPTHVALIDNFLPFEAFTQGFTNAQGVYEPGLNYELTGLLAAELPVSSSCDASTCFPMTPPEVITGSTQFDRDIGFFEALTGKATDGDGQPFSLFSDFYKVGIGQLLHGYTFDATDPSGPVNPERPASDSWVTASPATRSRCGTGPGDAEPWNGLDFHLNLLAPVQTLIDSWEQPVTGGIGGTGIEIPTIEGVAHTFENLFAGFIIDFDPFTEGSPACPALCDIPDSMKVPALVNDIAMLDKSQHDAGGMGEGLRDQPAVGQRADTGSDQHLRGPAADRHVQPHPDRADERRPPPGPDQSRAAGADDQHGLVHRSRLPGPLDARCHYLHRPSDRRNRADPRLDGQPQPGLRRVQPQPRRRRPGEAVRAPARFRRPYLRGLGVPGRSGQHAPTQSAGWSTVAPTPSATG